MKFGYESLLSTPTKAIVTVFWLLKILHRDAMMHLKAVQI